MKRTVMMLLMATMALPWIKAMAEEEGKQQEIICSKSELWEKSIKRSLQLNMRVFLQTDYLLLMAAPTDTGNAHVIITKSEEFKEKEETVFISPNQETTIYIGDLGSGTYDLTIELENYTLYGSFEIE